MSTRPGDPQPQWIQHNTDGATGFQGGHHHHHWPGIPDPGVAVEASIRATTAGHTIGRPIGEWATGRAGGLGVNASITVHEETTLTPYILRPHDQQLRDKLGALTISGASSQLVIAVGNSCAGKTRTLYEALLAVLPDWRLIAPADDTDLAQILLGGVPARTTVWLDELQDRLTMLSGGIAAARMISALLNEPQVGPVLFVGTIWSDALQALTRRPTSDEAAAGAAAVKDLAARAAQIQVGDIFTDGELEDAPDDPRLRVAMSTATRQENGRKLTQVLAGGTQLVHRLHRARGTPGAFSPAARAIIHAAGDLRRVGMPNPLPRWVLEEAAPGYLDGTGSPTNPSWFQTALNELTRAATFDDPLTGTHTFDIRAEGIPALTPVGAEGYNLHDYLYHDHQTRFAAEPVGVGVWNSLRDAAEQGQLDPAATAAVGAAAHERGMYTTALHCLSGAADIRSIFLRRLAGQFIAEENELVRLRAEALGRSVMDPRYLRWIDVLAYHQGIPEARRLLEALAAFGESSAKSQLRDRAVAGAAPGAAELASLSSAVHRADSGAAQSLVGAYRKLMGAHQPIELDCLGRPVVVPFSWKQSDPFALDVVPMFEDKWRKFWADRPSQPPW